MIDKQAVDVETLDGQSLDTTQALKEKLYSLMPEVFTEGKHGKIDWEKLKATLGEDINFSNERYVLNWAGKSDAFRVMQEPTSKTLIPAKEESINFDESENIFIEGENLEVLKVLQKSYFGKIKMIYIDPPYNTGNDSFIYPDKFSETKEEYLKRVGDKDEEGYMTKEGRFGKNSKENGQYHSNWLNMMYPRLFLARNLLKDDGVIFVSIDDNEVHNLRLVMNEIFGEENFVASIIWERAFSPKNDTKYYSENHDYLLVYSKNISAFKPGRLDRTKETTERYKNLDNDSRGAWVSGDLTVKTYSEKYDYPITTPSGREVAPSHGSCWRVSQERFQELVKDKRIWFGKDGGNVPRLKRFLSEVQDGLVPTTLWKHIDVGHNQEGRQELKVLFDGKGYFDGPKPIRLLKQILKVAKVEKKDSVLDFFTGSGTLAHAVLDLNKEDGGNRKFICAQLPEQCDIKSEAYKAGYKTIADIAKERIRRVIQKIKDEQSGKLEFDNKPQDLGFKVYKLADSNFKQWHPKPKDTEAFVEQLKLHANPINGTPTPDSMVVELLLKSGLDLNRKIEAKDGFYVIGENELVIVLDKATESVFEGIAKIKPSKVIALDVVFKDNDQLKTNVALQMKDADIEFKTI